MKRSLRLIGLLVASITPVVMVVVWSEIRAGQFALQVELQRRAEAASERLREEVEPALRARSLRHLPVIIDRLVTSERLGGAAIFDARNAPVAVSSTLGDVLEGRAAFVTCRGEGQACGEFITLGTWPLYVYSAPLHTDLPLAGVLAIFLDASAISASSAHAWRNAVLVVAPQVFLIVVLAYVVLDSTVLEPISRTARWMRDLRFGRASRSGSVRGGLLAPISLEAANLAGSLLSAQASAETEARLREEADSLWTAERLRVSMHKRLHDTRLFVVANREPYEHVRRGKRIEAVVPASGVVTALEPVLCACDGTWIAHGSGDADREVVDERCRVRVPPDDPRYTLRRIWLTPEEEQGYYFGFANEGLWPLCHIAHTRPIFRATDWEHYRAVNEKFSAAVLDEMRNEPRPVLLIQDYHFALLPRLIKNARPDARIAVFWHIPWPNPEAFEICPWQRELLDGLLGADLLSFHIQAHCGNFLETIDRAFECRIEWERCVVERREHCTTVRPHPISVAFPEGSGAPAPQPTDREVRQRLGAEGAFLAVGVDRLDYTKGIIERFLGIERFLEKYPDFLGHFTLVQIGAPSRTRIKRYQDFRVEVETEALRINERFGTGRTRPIQLLTRQHSHEEITALFRVADMCLVTSLHDGMNLVAKEFVASRDDEDGVLVLSRFTGACRELGDALRVNPYDIEEMAETILAALVMHPDERQARMRNMRHVVKTCNVYRWAAELISDVADMRPAASDAMRVP